MKAVVVERCGEAIWREVGDPPEPGPYQALVRTTAFSLCNATDLHIRNCRLMGATQERCPFLLGHESVGEVIALGPKVRNFRAGDHVFRPMLRLPGFNSYWGGMAEYGLVADLRAHEEDGAEGEPGGNKHQLTMPRSIPPADAVVLITLKEVLAYLNSIGARPGSRLLITGQGPVGLAAAYLARELVGVERIVVAGRRPETAELVCSFGADAYVDTRAEGWPARAVEALGGPADVIYETTGSAEVTAAAFEALADNGVMGPYAARTTEQAAEPLPDDERYGPSSTDETMAHDAIIQAVLRADITVAQFISHRLPPEEIQHAFELVEARAAIKIVFEL